MYGPNRKQIVERWNLMPDILREAVTSSLLMDDLDAIQNNYHLSDAKTIQLSKLVRGVFYGLIHSEDLYKEIKDVLQIDPRLALEIYHEIDKKIFQSVKKDIEDNFIKFKLGAVKESEISRTEQVPSQVVLKGGPEIINLKPETSSFGVTPTKIKIESATLEKTKEPGPVSLGNIQSTTNSQQPTIKPTQFENKPENKTIPEGPFILHKMDEAQSVSGTQATSGYKQTSFGGYFGSMKTVGTQKPQDTISSARIEMPFDLKPKEGDGQKVPVVVKKYEAEPVKTVHISNFKTPLEKTPDGALKPITPPQPTPISQKKPSNGDGMIDLLNLTIKK